MRCLRIFLAFLFVLSGPAEWSHAQKIEAKVLSREIIEQRLQVSGKNPERKARLFQLFLEAECPEAQLKPKPSTTAGCRT